VGVHGGRFVRTLITGRWVVGFDGRQHRLIDNGMVVLEDDRIVHVGRRFDGEVDRTIDAGRFGLVSPGFVNVHSHSGTHAGTKMIADFGRPDLFGCGYLNYQVPGAGKASVPEPPGPGARLYVWELLRNGTTTAVDVGPGLELAEAVVETAGALGLRLYVGPGFGDIAYQYDARGVIQYVSTPEAGQRRFEAAVGFVKHHDRAFGGRVRGLIVPAQIDTNSPDLLRQARAVATELGVPISTHAAQNLKEFHRILQTTGRSPVALLDEVGFLGPDAILGHAIFTAEHPWSAYPGPPDLPRIAHAGASVGHCPNAYSHRALTMISFDRYRKAGVNVGLGTDTYPRDVIHEMRIASATNKLIEGNVLAAPAEAVYEAATLGGARALGRADLGRLAPGAKADLTIVDLGRPRIGVVRDPIQSLVQSATGDDVTSVIVDGRVVVEHGEVLGIDAVALRDECQAAAEAYWQSYGGWDLDGLLAEERFPPSLAPWSDDPA
jgi:5-methylthioadenosine/S-adenosylhomocysteine deaminase